MIILDILQTLLTSGATIAMLKIVEIVISWTLKRKEIKDDKAAGKVESDAEKYTREISEIKNTVEILRNSQKVSMHDRIKYLARRYIMTGEISFEDRKDLKAMHEAYHILGGNGDLDDLMDSVTKLSLKPYG